MILLLISDDRGGRGVKNIKKLMMSFMNGPKAISDQIETQIK